MPNPIRRLSDTTINKIAAGEVIERPASAVKEMVENALDAGATEIRIDIAQGGKSLIRVHDNGVGIPADELPLAVERHATSKLDEADIFAIAHLGFRGEALASIGSVSRLKLSSRTKGQEGWMVAVEGGAIQPPRPTAHPYGTTVEVRDLFYATPARLKFLGSDRAEMQAISDTVRRLSLCAPEVAISLHDHTDGDTRTLYQAPLETGDLLDKGHARVGRVLGRAVMERCVRLDASREGARVSGWIGLPDTARGSSTAQFIFVNGRSVRDKALSGALKGAYQDLLPSGRHPVAVLFLDVEPEAVDVNVHPTKAEVRFRAAGEIRGLLVASIRTALAESGHRAPAGALPAPSFGPLGPAATPASHTYQAPAPRGWSGPVPAGQAEALFDGVLPLAGRPVAPGFDPETGEVFAPPVGQPLGRPIAHLYDTYILAQAEAGLVLIDAHAAHERLVYEGLKAHRAQHGVASQMLLLPEVVDLDRATAGRLEEAIPPLSRLGFVVEPFGGEAALVRAVPAALANAPAKALLIDALDALDAQGAGADLERRLDAVASRIACHGSVRSGRPLRLEEMDALLRAMEATPGSDRCNHGRPTSLALKRGDLDTLFGR